jgi:hypothetical protein
MPRLRLAWVLPVICTLLTSGLWFWSRTQYQAFGHSAVTVNASSPEWEGLPEIWTDFTPVPLEIAGALNAPVATFAYPMYQLLHSSTPKMEVVLAPAWSGGPVELRWVGMGQS